MKSTVETRKYDKNDLLVKIIITSFEDGVVTGIYEEEKSYDSNYNVIKVVHSEINKDISIKDRTTETRTYNSAGLLIETVTERLSPKEIVQLNKHGV